MGFDSAGVFTAQSGLDAELSAIDTRIDQTLDRLVSITSEAHDFAQGGSPRNPPIHVPHATFMHRENVDASTHEALDLCDIIFDRLLNQETQGHRVPTYLHQRLKVMVSARQRAIHSARAPHKSTHSPEQMQSDTSLFGHDFTTCDSDIVWDKPAQSQSIVHSLDASKNPGSHQPEDNDTPYSIMLDPVPHNLEDAIFPRPPALDKDQVSFICPVCRELQPRTKVKTILWQYGFQPSFTTIR